MCPLKTQIDNNVLVPNRVSIPFHKPSEVCAYTYMLVTFYSHFKPDNSDFETLTDDLANLKWPEPKLLSSSLPVSGVLSDSALQEINDK